MFRKKLALKHYFAFTNFLQKKCIDYNTMHQNIIQIILNYELFIIECLIEIIDC